jgi:hypothetical protein
MRYIDYGSGILQNAALQSRSESWEFDLVIVYEQLAKDQGLAAYEVTERFYEIGSHDGIKDFRNWLAFRSSGAD